MVRSILIEFWGKKMLWLKWTALVWLNAIIGLFFSGFGTDWAYNIGIILGVCVFIPIYALIDRHAIQTDNKTLQKSLLISVLLRVCMQLIMVVDLFVGIIAQGIAKSLLGSDAEYDYMDGWHLVGFWDGFLTTVLMGGMLSVLVFVLGLFVMLMIGFFSK